MRRLFVLTATPFTLLALALATSAQALQFQGQVSFSLSTLPALVVSGSGWGMSIATPPKPGPGVLGDVVTITSYPPTYPLPWAASGPVRIGLGATGFPVSAISISLVAPGPCSFTDAPGNALGGPCALGGAFSAWVAGAPFLVVPLSGLGVAARVGIGPHGSYFDAQSWQTGIATVTINGVPLTTNGVPITTVGYDNRTTLAGYGTVKLVAPAGLMSTLSGNLPLFASMKLTFVPEPGELLLLGSGIASLALLGLMRMRR